MARQEEPGWKFLGSQRRLGYNLLTSNPIHSMLIDTVCTNCDAILKAPEAVLGRRVKCTKCGKPFVARRPGDDDANEELPSTVKMKAPNPPLKKRKIDEDEDDATEEAAPVRAKKSARDEDTAVMEKARPSRDDDEDEDEVPKPKGKKKGKKGKKKAASSPVMMYVLIGIGALVLIGGGIGAYVLFFRDDSKPTTNSSGAGTAPGGPSGQASATAGWVEINEAEGKYKLKFPTQPVSENVKQDSPAGEVALKVYRLGGKSELFFSTHESIPDRGGLTDEQLLAQAVQAIQSQIKGATVSIMKPLSYQTFTGREFEMNMPGKSGSMIVRTILAPNRVIILLAAGESVTAGSPRVKAFFESLKIE